MKIIKSSSFKIAETLEEFRERKRRESIERAKADRALLNQQKQQQNPGATPPTAKPKSKISIQNMFYQYIIPRAKDLFPSFPIEHYSLDVFSNMNRAETGLDNRRENDLTFMNAGKEIHQLSIAAQESFGTPQFNANIDALIKRLYKWYFEESASGTVVQRKGLRQIDYDDLTKKGIRITPEEGKEFVSSSSRNLGTYRTIVKDGFRKAYFAYIISGRKDIELLKAWQDARYFVRIYKDEIEYIYKAFKTLNILYPYEKFWMDFAARVLDFSPVFNQKVKDAVISISETKDEKERMRISKETAKAITA